MLILLWESRAESFFSYDGTDRIRFTGQGVASPNLSRKHRHPEEGYTYAVGNIVAQKKAFVKRQKPWYNAIGN